MQVKIENQEIKLKSFTFQPEINLKSKEIMKKKGTITPIYCREDNKYKKFQKAESERYHKAKN